MWPLSYQKGNIPQPRYPFIKDCSAGAVEANNIQAAKQRRHHSDDTKNVLPAVRDEDKDVASTRSLLCIAHGRRVCGPCLNRRGISRVTYQGESCDVRDRLRRALNEEATRMCVSNISSADVRFGGEPVAEAQEGRRLTLVVERVHVRFVRGVYGRKPSSHVGAAIITSTGITTCTILGTTMSQNQAGVSSETL